MKSLSLTRTALVTVLGLLPLGALAQNGGMMNAPFAHGASMTTEQALKEAPKQDTSLAPLAKSYATAQATYKKKPKDAKLKTAYVDAAYKYGHAIMVDQGKMSPSIQYRAALALYRKALAANPKHGPSMMEKKQIEDIYRSMGRPVPK